MRDFKIDVETPYPHSNIETFEIDYVKERFGLDDDDIDLIKKDRVVFKNGLAFSRSDNEDHSTT